MIIGIDASRAFLKNRTGIEEYSYRVIEYLQKEIPEETRVVLYTRQGTRDKGQGGEGAGCRAQEGESQSGWVATSEDLLAMTKEKIGDLELPKNWEIREIKWNRFWTQGGLAWEMFRRPVDVLFVPAHTVPWVHPKKTVVVVHGLEFEMCPGAYSLWERFFMRITIRLSCQWAWRVIAVSENTKKDLMRLYGVSAEKIRVIYEGYETQQETRDKRQETGGKQQEIWGTLEKENFQFPISNFQSISNDVIPQCLDGEENAGVSDLKIQSLKIDSKFKIQNSKFLLFIGRIEERKNVARIIEAFAILKEKYSLPHKLVLAGKPGHGFERIKLQVTRSKFREDIVELGYISEEEKWELFSCAEVLVFPSLYEGFGLPILEAQAAGVPVVTSNVSSMPEVVGKRQETSDKRQETRDRGQETRDKGQEMRDVGQETRNKRQRGVCNLQSTTYNLQPVSAVLVDPYDTGAIAQGIWLILSDNIRRERLVSLGYENVKRFSWGRCAFKANVLFFGD